MANHFKPFNDLTPEEKQTVIQKQQHAKEAKKLRRAALDDLKPSDPKPSGPYPTRIQKDEYFSACPEGLCCDPFLKAGESYVDLILLHTLTTKNLIDYNYFMFCGSDEEVWDKTLFVKLAFEGFFTITIPNEHIRPGKLLSNEPLAELQPFYSVIDWQNFEATKHVKGTLKRLRKIQHVRYRLRSSHDGTLVWNAIQHYHSSKHGCNWLTKEYLDAMTRAHEDSSLNFRMHAIELYEEAGGSSQLVAGEIGYSVGRIYTSMSGFSARKGEAEAGEAAYSAVGEGVGHTQLVLLGRWLQMKGYAFWSMGHCYRYNGREGSRSLHFLFFLFLSQNACFCAFFVDVDCLFAVPKWITSAGLVTACIPERISLLGMRYTGVRCAMACWHLELGSSCTASRRSPSSMAAQASSWQGRKVVGASACAWAARRVAARIFGTLQRLPRAGPKSAGPCSSSSPRTSAPWGPSALPE